MLAMHLRGEIFSAEEDARNFAYYEALTVRDSSLSACTQAVLAAETGHLDLAYDYLTEAALMDLDDLEHNTRDGLHLACLAGTWSALVSGLAGLRERNGGVALPRGCRQALPAWSLLHDGQRLTVSTGSPISVPNLTPPSRPAPIQSRGRAPSIIDEPVTDLSLSRRHAL